MFRGSGNGAILQQIDDMHNRDVLPYSLMRSAGLKVLALARMKRRRCFDASRTWRSPKEVRKPRALWAAEEQRRQDGGTTTPNRPSGERFVHRLWSPEPKWQIRHNAICKWEDTLSESEEGPNDNVYYVSFLLPRHMDTED